MKGDVVFTRGDVYVKTGRRGKSVRHKVFGFDRWGATVVIDINEKDQIIGVEVINASEVRVDGVKL